MENKNKIPVVDTSNNKFVKILHDSFNDEKKSSTTQRKWTKEEDDLLLEIVENYTNRKIKWPEVSNKINGKTTRQCYSRYRQINPKLNKGAWTDKEDNDLMHFSKKYGKKWSMIAKLMKTRSSKQIRDRYLNCLDENLTKTPFSAEDDQRILELVQEYGSNWSLIAKQMPGRTGDNIKNRYNWSIRYKLEKPLDIYEISNISV